MKKKVLGFAVIFTMVLMVFSTVASNDYLKKKVLDPGQGGGGGSSNSATCYSTYSSPLLGGGTNIWRCGSCVSVKAKNFSDSGVCNF